MKKIIIAVAATICMLSSCEKYETLKTVDYDYSNNFEKFWNLVNENYCFLGDAFANNDKLNYLDWQAVYDQWQPKAVAAKDDAEFFNILGKCLDELRDGHVWMISDFKTYSNHEFKLKPDGVTYYEEAFEKGRIEKEYLNKGGAYDEDKAFKTRNGFIYGTIERDGKKFAYIYHGEFSKTLTGFDLHYINPVVENADAIIYDIRNNPGGTAMYGIEVAGFFMKEKTLVGYSVLKDGPGYNDFANPKEIYAVPSNKCDWSDKQTAVLTDRGVYSTANIFTNATRYAPNVIRVGQRSGGGGGLPATHHLPNGWLVVFSSNILLDADMKHIEPGIAPDFEASLGTDPTKDGILEKAIEELSKKI